ncbi:MFS transporter [Biformimicrobium ophioploci]|uniref:Major facilitator superfamily (MFS) profile domain-containing protein n=1 Tax=Biformimicrobium ophioploci TaxID=3036711 RepID=A0ABQ6M0Q1_9GAMM|nr:MFS transporter [Microbulbifer sp. NKW57]GMG87928.1 hypothetical protein MNKW57_22490 [Microbulbifer sp. NKW57]
MKKYLIEILMFVSYALFAASWVSGAIVTPEIQAEFGEAGLANATWGSNAITIAKIIGNLAAAAILMKLGTRIAFSIALILIAAGGVGAFAGSYDTWVISRLLLGLGGALVIVYFSPLVLHYFSPEERPTINGINAAAFNTGNLLALTSTGVLLTVLGSWQNLMLTYGIATAALLVLWWLASENIPLSRNADNKETEHYGYKDGLKDPVNWWLPLAYCGVLFCYIAIFALFPLIDGFAVKSTHLSAVMIAAGMFGTVAGIIATKKLARRIPVLRYSGLALTLFAAAMVLVREPVLAYSAAALAGFFMFLPMTALVTLPQELPGMTPARITVIFAMFWSVSYLIETGLMYGAGLLADSTGQPAMAAYFAVICSASLFVFSFALPETGKVVTKNEDGEMENATA